MYKSIAFIVVPLSLVIGFAAGVYVISGNMPVELVSRSITLLMGAYLGLVTIDLLATLIIQACTDILGQASLQQQSTTIHYVVTEGPVIEQLKTVRGYKNGVTYPRLNAQWNNALVRLGLRKTRVTVPVRDPLPGLEELIEHPLSYRIEPLKK